jgi:hypothetical protein
MKRTLPSASQTTPDSAHDQVTIKPYHGIVAHYEACLARHGDSHLGVDWPKLEDVEKRHRVMLEVIRPGAVAGVHLLDFGCGASHLYEYILRQDLAHIAYSGLDLSEKFVNLSRAKFPSIEYYCFDILGTQARLPVFDYVVMNGVFTEKREMLWEDMLKYCEAVIIRVFEHVRVGMAFNVMSKHVDWERDDLFHLSFDVLAAILKRSVSRHFVFRQDYGLYEYTVYVYR